MPQLISRPSNVKAARRSQASRPRVVPSQIDPRAATPFTLDQELEPFGRWASDPVWVPPKDASRPMAETLLQKTRLMNSREKKWESVVSEHRNQFTQIRQIDLCKASIRLPKGKFYVSVLEQKHFDKIEETIPACVQTRLDEFMAGPGKEHGVKVYYLKPLCVEVGDELVMTTEEDIMAAIRKIQDEVFAQYRQLSLLHMPVQLTQAAVNTTLAVPRSLVHFFVNRRQRKLDAYQSRLEFQRRRTALDAAQAHAKCRSDAGTFDEMLALTNPLDRADVIHQFCIEEGLTAAQRAQLLRIAAGTIPWFITLALTIEFLSSVSLTALTLSPPILVCDPAFVAEMPGSNGVVLKIGHFDEVGGVTHVEI
jgi:hypothetical protein